MNPTKRTTLLALAALLPGARAVHAQGLPTAPARPLNLVVPYPPGGASDVMARALAPLLAQQLGQVVIVENIGGAGGALGVQKVLAAPADGQTLLLGTPSETVLVPLALAAARYRSEQLRLLGRLGVSPLLLAARPDLPGDDLDSVFAAAVARGGKGCSYGSIGRGSLFHLAGEALRERTGVPLLHVPYKGVGPMTQDLLGGQIDLAFLPLAGNTLSLLDTRKLKPIGTATARRDPRLPRVPALSESRLVKDFDFAIWSGVFAPAGTPPAVALRLHEALAAVQRSPEFRTHIEGTGSAAAEVQPLDALAQLFEREAARYRTIARAIRLEAE